MSSSEATRLVLPPSQLFSGVLSPGAKRPGRESTLSGIFISEVKKEWSNTSTPLYSSHGHKQQTSDLCSLLLLIRAIRVIEGRSEYNVYGIMRQHEVYMQTIADMQLVSEFFTNTL